MYSRESIHIVIYKWKYIFSRSVCRYFLVYTFTAKVIRYWNSFQESETYLQQHCSQNEQTNVTIILSFLHQLVILLLPFYTQGKYQVLITKHDAIKF